MDSQATPEFLVSQMRVLTMPEMTFFYVNNQPTAFDNLERDLDPLLSSLYAAKALANIAEAGTDITRYYKVDDDTHAGGQDLYRMEVGIRVKPGILPAGEAHVKILRPYHCAGVLLWGSLAHVSQAYDALFKAAQEAGLRQTGECREWNYWFESGDSLNNLMGIYLGVL